MSEQEDEEHAEVKRSLRIQIADNQSELEQVFASILIKIDENTSPDYFERCMQ